MKYLLILTLILLSGCVEREYKTVYVITTPEPAEVVAAPEPEETIKKYIVAGQSNVG